MPEIPEFQVKRDIRVHPQGKIPTYGRVRTLHSTRTGSKVYWQYERQAYWLTTWRITFVAGKGRALQREEVEAVVRRCRSHAVTLLELAFDFPVDAGIDEGAVHQFARFGKSRFNPNRGGLGQLRFGSRTSPKLVRAYSKPEVGSYRVELELHRPLLRKLKIQQIRDFRRLDDKLIPRHFEFVNIRWDRLERTLARRFGPRSKAILKEARSEAAHSIAAFRKCLNDKSISNIHRFFASAKFNRKVEEALHFWCMRFQSRSQHGQSCKRGKV